MGSIPKKRFQPIPLMLSCRRWSAPLSPTEAMLSTPYSRRSAVFRARIRVRPSRLSSLLMSLLSVKAVTKNLTKDAKH